MIRKIEFETINFNQISKILNYNIFIIIKRRTEKNETKVEDEEEKMDNEEKEEEEKEEKEEKVMFLKSSEMGKSTTSKTITNLKTKGIKLFTSF